MNSLFSTFLSLHFVNEVNFFYGRRTKETPAGFLQGSSSPFSFLANFVSGLNVNTN